MLEDLATSLRLQMSTLLLYYLGQPTFLTIIGMRLALWVIKYYEAGGWHWIFILGLKSLKRKAFQFYLKKGRFRFNGQPN